MSAEMPKLPRTLLTAEELSEILQVPKTWVYQQARRGEIPTVPLPGGRYKRFDLQVIEELFLSGPKGSLTIRRKRKGSNSSSRKEPLWPVS